MSIGWIILGIFALGVLGFLAIYFFFVLEEAYGKWSWPKVLVLDNGNLSFFGNTNEGVDFYNKSRAKY